MNRPYKQKEPVLRRQALSHNSVFLFCGAFMIAQIQRFEASSFYLTGDNRQAGIAGVALRGGRSW
jgi:hypothetical protein